MKKQSKITVKHYLEKKVKPMIVYENLELGYPLYYRITYKTKTTNLKSFTGAVMTEKAYEQFNVSNTVNNYETNFKTGFINLKLENELFFIKKAVELVTKNDEDIGVFDEHFIENLKAFFKDLKDCLFSHAWRNYLHTIELEKTTNKSSKSKVLTAEQILKLKQPQPTKEDIDFNNSFQSIDEKNRHFLQEQFYYIFNKENSLIYSLNILKEATGFNAFPFIHRSTLKFWHVIELILKVYPNTLFIDFLVNFDIEKIKINNKDSQNVTNSEIIEICNKLKNSYI